MTRDDQQTTTAGPCRRYPCDYAHIRLTHTDGTHRASWLDAYDFGVSIDAHATEDGPWRVLLRLGDGAVSLDPEQTRRVVEALLRANETATSANLEDAR